MKLHKVAAVLTAGSCSYITMYKQNLFTDGRLSQVTSENECA